MFLLFTCNKLIASSMWTASAFVTLFVGWEWTAVLYRSMTALGPSRSPLGLVRGLSRVGRASTSASRHRRRPPSSPHPHPLSPITVCELYQLHSYRFRGLFSRGLLFAERTRTTWIKIDNSAIFHNIGRSNFKVLNRFLDIRYRVSRWNTYFWVTSLIGNCYSFTFNDARSSSALVTTSIRNKVLRISLLKETNN